MKLATVVRPILVDFGISKQHILGSRTSNGGTYCYLSPEQIENSLEPSLKSDVFSLGCCFIFIEAVLHSGREGLLAIEDAAMGTNACQFASTLSAIDNILKSTPGESVPSNPALNYFRQGFQHQVQRMLTPTPDQRPDVTDILNTFSGFEHELDALVERRYLELCVNTRWTMRLLEIVFGMRSDRELLNYIMSGYEQERNQAWGILACFFTIGCAECVKIVLDSDQSFKIQPLLSNSRTPKGYWAPIVAVRMAAGLLGGNHMRNVDKWIII